MLENMKINTGGLEMIRETEHDDRHIAAELGSLSVLADSPAASQGDRGKIHQRMSAPIHFSAIAR